MKFLFSFFICLNIYAQTNINDLVGNYQLTSSKSENCTSELIIKIKDFSNQKTEHSLAIYGQENSQTTDIIAQLFTLNLGPLKLAQMNPMTNQVSGYLYESEKLQDGKLEAISKSVDIFGNALWETNLQGTFENDTFLFKKVTDNKINNFIKIQTCSYKKL